MPQSQEKIEELSAEAKVKRLVVECQAGLQNEGIYESCCRDPATISSKKEQKLIATSNKPTVMFLYNRRNRYSDTNTFDNLLGNLTV